MSRINTSDTGKRRKRPLYFFRKLITRNIWAVWLLLLILLIIGLGCGIIGYGALGEWGDNLIGDDSPLAGSVFDQNPHASLLNAASDLQQKGGDGFNAGEKNGNISPLDSLYATLKLLKLGDLGVASANGYIAVARFILPLVVSFTVIFGFFGLLRRGYHRLRAYFFKDHTIVCGLGERGYSVLKDAINSYNYRKRDNLNLLVIEKNPNNPFIKFCHEEGITVFVGDACISGTLYLTRPWAANEIYSFIPGDGQNLALANALAEVFCEKKKSRYNQKPKCYLTIDNEILQYQFMDRKIFFKDAAGEKIPLPIEVNLHNSQGFLSERAIAKGVRDLFVKTPAFLGAKPGDVPSVVLLGAGYMGRLIIEYLSTFGHLKNEINLDSNGSVTYSPPLKIIVYDKNPDAEHDLYNRYPALQRKKQDGMKSEEEMIIDYLNRNYPGTNHRSNVVLPLPEIEFHEGDVSQLDTLLDLADRISKDNSIAAVISALGDDSLSVSTALQLEEQVKDVATSSDGGNMPKILVYYPKFGGFETVFGTGAGLHLQSDTGVGPFCKWSSLSYDKHLSNDMLDNVAIGINACYDIHAKIMNSKKMHRKIKHYLVYSDDCRIPNNETRIPNINVDKKNRVFSASKDNWNKLSVSDQMQNRKQALHNQIKLNLLGYSVAKDPCHIPDGFEPLCGKKPSSSLNEKEKKNLVNTYLKGWRSVSKVLKQNAKLLSRIEHQRWWAEHLMSGWHFNETKNKPLKHHCDMIPFEYITRRDQSYDVFAVQDMVFSFKYAGYFPIRKKEMK